MTDESVCRGLHKAARDLRGHWLSMPGNATHGSKSVKKEDASLRVNELGTHRANDGDQKDTRLPRDIVLRDDDDEGVGTWVPYVHFGV